jgi:hypothetical protein
MLLIYYYDRASSSAPNLYVVIYIGDLRTGDIDIYIY